MLVCPFVALRGWLSLFSLPGLHPGYILSASGQFVVGRPVRVANPWYVFRSCKAEALPYV